MIWQLLGKKKSLKGLGNGISKLISNNKLSLQDKIKYLEFESNYGSILQENQDGGVGRHTASPRTNRIDRKSNGNEVQHQGNKK